ncbi:hypothetical protein P879_08491 [Paragonimus westermani]|uniref:Uncharacterized protein n=1 Tax=Paragonimus westermani TaxID=34504 RepID=A0A8T0DE67_9TREM|nr:hypothetical protein P879_08491 [Paragonimus westermani]
MALYFVDWRVLFSRIPGYRRKFKVDDINTNGTKTLKASTDVEDRAARLHQGDCLMTLNSLSMYTSAPVSTVTGPLKWVIHHVGWFPHVF